MSIQTSGQYQDPREILFIFNQNCLQPTSNQDQLQRQWSQFYMHHFSSGLADPVSMRRSKEGGDEEEEEEEEQEQEEEQEEQEEEEEEEEEEEQRSWEKNWG